jgi:hypothetical protein
VSPITPDRTLPRFNAATRHGGEWNKWEAVPGTFNAIEQMADDIGGKANHRTLEVLQPMLDEWRRKELEEMRSQGAGANSDQGFATRLLSDHGGFRKNARPEGKEFF